MVDLIHTIRVRYVECDQMGFVHHSNYAVYFEEARTEILRKMGLLYFNMEKDNIIMPVRYININFKYAARYDDLLKIRVIIKEKPMLKCLVNYEVTNQEDKLLCTAETLLFFANKIDLKPCRLSGKYLNIVDTNWPE